MSRLIKIFFVLPVLLLLAACSGNGEGDSQAIEVGANAPDFTLPTASGGEVSLSDYRGQPVLLYFHMAVG